MNHEFGSLNHHIDYTHSTPLSPRFLIYSTACIVVILLAFRHIKYLHRLRIHSRAIPPERQKMSPYSPDITGGGGEQHEKSSLFASVPASHIPNHSLEESSLENPGPFSPISSPSAAPGGVGGGDDGGSSVTAPFPSASDILQPLSQLAPLPTSGHVAAAVSRGSKLDWNFSSTATDAFPDRGQNSRQTHLQPGSPGADSDLSSDESHPAVPVGEEDPVSGAQAVRHAVPVSRSAPGQSPRAYCQPPPFPGTVVYGPPFCGSFLFAPVMRKDEEVQKRNEMVQFCQESDVEGVRSWRRLIVEYT